MAIAVVAIAVVAIAVVAIAVVAIEVTVAAVGARIPHRVAEIAVKGREAEAAVVRGVGPEVKTSHKESVGSSCSFPFAETLDRFRGCYVLATGTIRRNAKLRATCHRRGCP